MAPSVSGSSDDTHTVGGAAQTSIEFGPYRLLQRLGEGGMGEVWLAEQTRPVRRQVALKIIKAGMDTAQVVARFEAERQALALMDHPAIATVFDGGSTPEGRPYFAMEYVRGEPITTYCDRQRLGTKERLELLILVCEGVQHAHQKGVIHRDLKPSNVLVTLQDGKPVPKIIDFGVAKAITRLLTERTLFTELGVLIGTPEYMSPEQAELTAFDIDTRTDVYGLGVLLYELLTGTLPLDRQMLREQSLDAIRRAIREVDPPSPSTRITQLGPASAEAAKNRQTEPARLASQLRGDLDWVTMKALEKDRTRRYESAIGLAADLGRHLRDEAVSAGPPSSAYRAQKFVRRHRFGVAAAATLVLLLTAFGATMSVQAQRIARERDRANQEARTAKQVSSFLVGLFELAKPSEAAANSVTAREVLDTGSDRIAQDLQGQTQIQATLVSTMADAYHSLGLYARAEALHRQSQSLHRKAYREDSPEVARTRVSLARTLERQAKYEDAERLIREALVVFRASSAEVADLAVAHKELAWVLRSRGKLDEAEAAVREALRLYGSIPDASKKDVADCVSVLGGVLFEKADFAGAEQAFDEVLALRRQLLGRNHPRTVSATANLALAWLQQREFAKAEGAYRELVAINRQQLGPDHAELAISLNNLGAVLFFQERYDEAEALYRQALAINRRAFGERHPAVATDLANIGQVLSMQRRFGEAERVLKETVEIRESVLGPDHPNVAVTLTYLADSLCRNGKAVEAEQSARRALEMNARRLGASHPRTKESEGALGCALAKRGRFDEAEPLLLSYAAALEKNIGAEGDLGALAVQIADMYRLWGKAEKAAEWRRKVAVR